MNFLRITKNNSDTFNNHINGSRSVVFVLADWCGHCKVLKPHLKTIQTELENSDTLGNIITIDSEALQNINSEHTNDITGFPEIFHIDEYGKKEPYDRESRNYDNLIQFIFDKLKLEKVGGSRKVKSRKVRSRKVRSRKVRSRKVRSRKVRSRKVRSKK